MYASLKKNDVSIESSPIRSVNISSVDSTNHAAGQGRWTYPDGSFYEGEWTEGQRIRGRLLAVDGSEEYSGEWKGDKRHGQGVQYRRGVFKYAGQSWKTSYKRFFRSFVFFIVTFLPNLPLAVELNIHSF